MKQNLTGIKGKTSPDVCAIGKRVWELPTHLHCSVCGTCLTMAEHRDMLSKLKLDYRELADYQIHNLFVNALSSENKLSRMADRYLNRKYRFEIRKYADLNDQEFLTAWKEKKEEGNIAGLYWAAVTSVVLDEKTLEVIIGEAHMFSHLQGMACCQANREAKTLAEENQKLKTRLRVKKEEIKKMTSELESSRLCIGRLENRLGSLAAENGAPGKNQEYLQLISDLRSENQQLELKLDDIKEKSAYYREEARKLNVQKDELENELLQQRETITQLCQEIHSLSDSQAICSQSIMMVSPENPKRGRVLMVGGNSRLNPFYRQVAEDLGWDFEYHDGCLSAGRDRLEDMVKRSDLVLCSLDINSHGACHCVKQLSCKLKKECCLLTNTSLSSMARALSQREPTFPA